MDQFAPEICTKCNRSLIIDFYFALSNKRDPNIQIVDDGLPLSPTEAKVWDKIIVQICKECREPI